MIKIFNKYCLCDLFRIVPGSALFLIIPLMAGCEYNLDKTNFVEIEKPPSEVLIDLSLLPAGDTIQVFKPTEFTYTLSSQHSLLGAEVSVGGATRQYQDYFRSYSVNPDDYSDGYYKMKFVFYIATNSGSIADKLGAEAYTVEKELTIHTANSFVNPIKANYSITPEGFLQISWDECKKANFMYYEVTKSHTVFDTYYESGKTIFIDSCFVGGDGYYTINTKLQYKEQVTRGEELKVKVDLPELSIASPDYYNLNINWTKSPLNVYYRLYDAANHETYIESTTDTSCQVRCPSVGEYINMHLTVLPYSNKCQLTSEVVTQNFHIGERIASNWPEYGFNNISKTFYTNTHSEIKCFDLQTKELLTEINLDIQPNAYSCPTNSSKVAVCCRDFILVFEDKQLQNPIEIPIPELTYPVHFLMTDNGYISYVYLNKYYLIDIDTKKIINSFSIDEIPTYNYIGIPYVTTSRDASYLCSVSSAGCQLYKFENQTHIKTHNDNRSYQSVYFDPNDENTLLVTIKGESKVEFRNPADFSLIKTLQLPSDAPIINIDPSTGYLFFNDGDIVYALDRQSGEIVHKLSAGRYKQYLLGNTIFSDNGFYLDLNQN